MRWWYGQPGAVAAARRFYNGQLEPDEVFPTVQKFLKAYNYKNSFSRVAKDIVLGHMPKMRPEALIFGYSQLLNGWSVMDRLGEIEVPTLVMAGRHDFLFPPEHQAILTDRLPNARLEIIESAGHNPQSERPTEVIELIKRFLLTSDPDFA